MITGKCYSSICGKAAYPCWRIPAVAVVFLSDYGKAFDFIDHRTLAAKLKEVEFPNSIVNWILNFLSDRSQRVKFSCDCLS